MPTTASRKTERQNDSVTVRIDPRLPKLFTDAVNAAGGYKKAVLSSLIYFYCFVMTDEEKFRMTRASAAFLNDASAPAPPMK